jgi:hypothetical protein
MSNNKTSITLILSMIISLLLITIGLSFAYFTANITNTEDSTTIYASGGVMNINYDGGENINAPNIFPGSDPFATKTFTLTGNNTTNTNMNYHIIFVIEENTFTEEALKYKLISTNTDDNGTIAPSINELKDIPTESNEIFLGNGSFESPTSGNKVHTYNLELYFPDTVEDQNDNQGKTFKSYISVRENKYEYNEIKGVNHPILFTGMTPIKWDENNNEIETIESDLDWYDYDNKKWANAKSADGSYWVWIPRYAYKIESCYHTSGEDCLALTGKEAGDIDVKFLKGRTTETKDSTTIETSGYEPGVKDTSMHHFLHPAFDFDDGYIGFWMAKFEPSVADQANECYTNPNLINCNVTNLQPKITPNASSWRYINLNNSYNVIKNIKNVTDIYGWDNIELDSRITTNLEWGAVAYLSKSDYGAKAEVWNNSYNKYYTGCSSGYVSSGDSTLCYEYNTAYGQKASTTHNIYGIYDMAGGSHEIVMANLNNNLGQSDFTYEDVLNINYIDNYKANYSLIYGDAVYETSSGLNNSSSWYEDYSGYLNESAPWFIRGGYIGNATHGGVYFYYRNNGSAFSDVSFRVTLISLTT